MWTRRNEKWVGKNVGNILTLNTDKWKYFRELYASGVLYIYEKSEAKMAAIDVQ
jgi:hypothetical protein